MKTIIIYHDNCADGFCAAWIANKFLNPVDKFIPMNYGQEPPWDDFDSNTNVWILDFSFKREVMSKILEITKRVHIFDHHKTAEKELKGFENCCTFDMNRSGAMIIADYFYGDIGCHYKKPWLVDYVQDRDLWHWKLPKSREVSAALGSYPFDFQVWDNLMTIDFEQFVNEGTAILRYKEQLVNQICKNAQEVNFLTSSISGIKEPNFGNSPVPENKGTKILCVNSGIMQSEIGEKLAKGKPFSVSWFEDSLTKKRRYSLRSDENGMDVSEIAKQFGGGGHKHAAGFEI